MILILEVSIYLHFFVVEDKSHIEWGDVRLLPGQSRATGRPDKATILGQRVCKRLLEVLTEMMCVLTKQNRCN